MQLIILAAGKGSRLPKKFRLKHKSLIKVGNKTIIEHNINFYNKFKKKILITGYKRKSLYNFAKNNNFKIIHNKKFDTSNMVYSMFLAAKYIEQDVVVCYGDIIFDPNIYDLLDFKDNIMPLNINWLNTWKKRMSIKDIKNDAEDIVISKNLLKSIGGRIGKTYPKFQYMGLFKLKKNTYFNLNKFFKKIKNPMIDMTTFINISLKKKKILFKIKKYKSYWYEIDNNKDLNFTSKDFKNKW